jgi:predicted nucleotidyltransferase component of viral defense system
VNEINTIDSFKRAVIKGLFTDDDLMEIFVLKGGNAIEFFYLEGDRSSFDIDISISKDFTAEELEKLKVTLERNIKQEFKSLGYTIFDFSLVPKPNRVKPNSKYFWGGYFIEFKVISLEKFQKAMNYDEIRRNSEKIKPNHSPKLTVDISKFEYIDIKEKKELDGLTVYVYPIHLIIIEKLRAICQQNAKYSKIIDSHTRRPRPRDFYDIYKLKSKFNFEFNDESFEILKQVFIIKEVPLSYLLELSIDRDFHESDYTSLKDSINRKSELQEFNFYFNFVLDMVQPLSERIIST